MLFGRQLLDLDATVRLHPHRHIEGGLDRADIVSGVAVRIEMAVAHHARVVAFRAAGIAEEDDALGADVSLYRGEGMETQHGRILGAGLVAFVTTLGSVGLDLDI